MCWGTASRERLGTDPTRYFSVQEINGVEKQNRTKNEKKSGRRRVSITTVTQRPLVVY